MANLYKFKACKPGKIRNPHTGRCIKANGPLAKKLEPIVIKLQKYARGRANRKKVYNLRLKKIKGTSNKFSRLPQNTLNKIYKKLNKKSIAKIGQVSKQFKNNSYIKSFLKRPKALAEARKKYSSFNSSIKRVLKQIHPNIQASDSFLKATNSILNHTYALIMDFIISNLNTTGALNNQIVKNKLSNLPQLKDSFLLNHALIEIRNQFRIWQERGFARLDFRATAMKNRMNKDLKVLGLYPKHYAGFTSAVAMSATLEYICAELCELSGNIARNSRKKRITRNHLRVAVDSDHELGKLLKNYKW